MEGKQLEGREKNFKQMFEGRHRNVEGLENNRENGVGRGIFERDENLSYRLHGSTQRIMDNTYIL
ncbi:hypothetical protein EG352_17610 [Chryseobacterium indologenes]|uniref:Uncharacterized protein n=1 Tax=Chryseobacterium indologenes TaxID=253 RepID=A0AAD0YXS8_CHRID|nr:hypothetical protein EG352_17610 [Chryseobacterium indologenes]